VVKEFRQKAASHVVPLLRTERSLLLRTPQQRLPMLLNMPDKPKIVPYRGGSWPPSNNGTFGQPGSAPPPPAPPKRHLDRFSRFCTAHERDQHTDTHRQTDHVTASAAMARILCDACDVAYKCRTVVAPLLGGLSSRQWLTLWAFIGVRGTVVSVPARSTGTLVATIDRRRFALRSGVTRVTNTSVVKVTAQSCVSNNNYVVMATASSQHKRMKYDWHGKVANAARHVTYLPRLSVAGGYILTPVCLSVC